MNDLDSVLILRTTVTQSFAADSVAAAQLNHVPAEI